MLPFVICDNRAVDSLKAFVLHVLCYSLMCFQCVSLPPPGVPLLSIALQFQPILGPRDIKKNKINKQKMSEN